MTDPLFAPIGEPKVFGQVSNGRYHMPLLPGEAGTRAGGDYVPRGCTRMTNVAGAIEDQRALNVHEQAMALIGLALDEGLYEEAVVLIQRAQLEGVRFEVLREYPELKEKLAGAPYGDSKDDQSILGRAKERAGASVAARKGTNRHDVWEERGASGHVLGTRAMREQLLETERLLAEAGLQRVQGLQERVVRNTVLNAVGRFDDILLELATGRLLMADLKTKATPFFSYMTVDAQLAGYAYAEYMLADRPSDDGLFAAGEWYEDGPYDYVDLTEGVVLHTPSDGSPASLERADLVHGWEVAQTAAKVLELRSFARSTGRKSRSAWVPKNLELTS